MLHRFVCKQVLFVRENVEVSVVSRRPGLGENVAEMTGCSTDESLLWTPASNATSTCSETLQRFNEALQGFTIYPLSHEALQQFIEALRAGCTNAQLTIWLANRGLTLTAQLTRCRVARNAVN